MHVFVNFRHYLWIESKNGIVAYKALQYSQITDNIDEASRSVAYLGGRGGPCPPFGPTMKIFYRRLYMKRCVFFVIFQQELQNSTMFDGLLRFQISEKWANLRFPLNIQKQKVFQLQGGKAPLTLQPGALPLVGGSGAAPRPAL